MSKRDYVVGENGYIEFDQSTLQRANALLKRSIFINGAEVTAPPAFNQEYVERILNNGITACFKLMVAQTYEDNFKMGCLRLNAFKRFRDMGVMIVKNGDDIREAKKSGTFGIVLGSQFTEIYDDAYRFDEMLEIFYDLGMRVQQIAYQRRGLFGDGSGEPHDAGLSLLGIEMVKKLDELGMLVELSHVGEVSTYQAIELSKHPLLISHSNAKAVCNHIRNKSDRIIKSLCEKGGVIGINAVSPYLNSNVGVTAVLDDWLDHVEHIVNICGIDHVSVGLDIAGHFGPKEFERQNEEFPSFGGAAYTFDQWHIPQLYEVEQWKNIIPGLMVRGYSDEDIEKVIGGNILRIMDTVLGHNK